MNHCTDCNFPLDDDMLECPQCGADVSTEEARQGIPTQPALGSETVNYAVGESPLLTGAAEAADDPDKVDTISASEHEQGEQGKTYMAADEDRAQQEATEESENAGTGTVSAPGVEGGLNDDDDDDYEALLKQTLDEGLTELDEADEFEFDDDLPGVIGDREPASTVFGTIEMPGNDGATEADRDPELTDVASSDATRHTTISATDLPPEAANNSAVADDELQVGGGDPYATASFDDAPLGVGAADRADDPYATTEFDDAASEAHADALAAQAAAEEETTDFKGSSSAPNRTLHAASDGTFADVGAGNDRQQDHLTTVSASGEHEPLDDTPESEDSDATDPHATVNGLAAGAAGRGGATIDIAGEDRPTHQSADGRGTLDATSDEQSTRIATGSAAFSGSTSGDETGTVALPDGGESKSPGDKTLIYDSAQRDNSTIEASGMSGSGSGASGTEGRLKRLWEGVAGSSENPMNSLHAVGQQASDSVFQRVATRKVADANLVDPAADYQIVNKLGEGAMGIVYSARQTAVNRIVAIKAAKPSFQANEESRRRFLYEAHITADLDHSNIVPIHELGADEKGMLFYSMKLVKGTEWSRVMRKKTREQNLEIFMKVTDAMAFAHDKGVIHRDLKPENTMLGPFGEVFVTDWGTAINLDKDTTRLAKPANKGDRFLTVEDASNFVRGDSVVLLDSEQAFDRVQIVSFDEANSNRIFLRKKLTQNYEPSTKLKVMKVMNLAGTPCYMAPEMAGHQLPRIGKTSDIYILGAILFDIVTGRPPHTGDSVTQCLRAALKNDIIVEDNDDALLTIAYRAMATDPRERYQTVEELQEAVREYRRHAESITLTERSDDLLTAAIAKKDYETFSRTLFGYRDAIELWPENTAATAGLKKARLAYGEAAFAGRDYDLVLQTLDRDQPDEAALYDQAVVAKKKAAGREASLKLLQKVVAAVVLFAVVGLSGLSIYAFAQSARATLAAAKEKKAREAAVASEQVAKTAAAEEKKAKEAALKSERDAREAAAKENAAKLAALKAEDAAKEAAAKEEKAKLEAVASEVEAIKAKDFAQEQEKLAVAAANLAKRRAAEIQLGEYNSSLALAKSQIESFDLAASEENLARLQSLFTSSKSEATNSEAGEVDVFAGNGPKIDTWGWQRIKLLSNADLPKTRIGGVDDGSGESETQVTVTDYSPAANAAVVGTRQGLVQVIQYDDKQLNATRQIDEDGATINAVTMSPDGKEVVYSFTRGKESGLRRWQVERDEAQNVVAAQKRPFQYLTYTTDGKQMVAGINGGVWLWDIANDWHAQDAPSKRIDSIRGELRGLQGIGPGQTLITAYFAVDDRLKLALLDHQSGDSRIIEVPESVAPLINSATHTRIDNQLALGLINNRLMIGTLSGATLNDLTELEERHRAPVSHIVTNGNGVLISSSINEPVAHVWQFDADDNEWHYDTYLTGTPKNIAGLGLLDSDRVLAVDSEGLSIVWDVQRQKQRRRLQRRYGNQNESYVAPVKHIVSGNSQGKALAIDANGVVDVWNLTDGSTQRLDENRWSYIGHTPGAELVDSAVDLERGVVVTAASLQNAKVEYLANPEHKWEFCVWDATTGEMQKRWSTERRKLLDNRVESIEQRISLVDQGRQILFASDSETRLTDLETGRETILSDFGSYFAVPNPRTPSLLALVKRSGAVRLFDLRNPNSWGDQSLREYGLADPSDIPLRGGWSTDGQRFYLTFATGGIAAFRWDGQRFYLTWSNRQLEEGSDVETLRKALSVDSGRIKSHLDVDLQVGGGGEQLHVAIRNRGLNPTTKLVSLRFDSAGSNPVLVSQVRAEEVRWLQVRENQPPTLTNRIHDVLYVDGNRIRSRVKMSGQTFVSTNGAEVYALVDGRPQIVSYGRAPLVSATGSRDGHSLLALLEDGAIWKFSLNAADQANWERLDYSALGASEIQLSPDGNRLLIVNGGEGQLVDPQSGRKLADIGPVLAANWDARAEARLAVSRPSGELELLQPGANQKLARRLKLEAETRIVGLHVFNEIWGNGQAPRQFLLVHSENKENGQLEFIPIDAAPAGAVDAEPATESLPLGARVAVSPTENILLSGTPTGTVTVWFAAPTHERKPRQLFDLEGHRGASMTSLDFTSDGQTIITADSKNRLFAWLSQDPLK